MSDISKNLGRRFAPDPIVRRDKLGGVSAMTLWRWDRNPALRFPPPILINGRKYRDLDEIDRWVAERVADPAGC